MECFFVLLSPLQHSTFHCSVRPASVYWIHPQETAACFQRNILFASTFIREISCLLHVKNPETPPVLSDSRRHSDWKVTAVLSHEVSVTWKRYRIRQAAARVTQIRPGVTEATSVPLALHYPGLVGQLGTCYHSSPQLLLPVLIKWGAPDSYKPLTHNNAAICSLLLVPMGFCL